MSFTHLHLHSMYSLLDGAIRMKDLMEAVTRHGMSAVALTDHGNMFGAIDFYKRAIDAKVKPIIGMEAYVAGPKGRRDRSERVANHLILLARNAEGYANLRALSSSAYRDGFYFHPRIDKAILKERARGLIGMTACLGGEFTRACRNDELDDARRIAKEYQDIFEPGNFYLELQWNGMPDQERANANIKQLARDFRLPLVATADAHYLRREDAGAHELLMCIASGKTLADEKRIHHGTDKLYVCSPEEMRGYFRDSPEAVDNTMRIAESVERYPMLHRPMLPSFKVPADHTAESYLALLARQGLAKRLAETTEARDDDAYRARLELELSVINRMGFPGYFLIVQDFVNWSKQNGIPVGPGRGSGAGSLVAYSLRITDLDPIPFNLLFERFMNPDRVSMPDFDIDFCQDRRDEVIRYVQGKYGKDNVGQIITFGQLRAKSVLRDVCRVYGLPYAVGDRIAKLVPEILGITLSQAIHGDAERGFSGEPKLKALLETPEEFSAVADGKPVTSRDVINVALALEGLNRHASLHAAGIVIADSPLEDFVPVYQPAGEDALVTQFAKDEVEAAGLVKFDFLGLRTLTVIDKALKLINRGRSPADALTIDSIKIDDEDSYKLMADGRTAGIFQVESSGYTEMVVQMRPTRFEDIIAAGALFRPGTRNQKLDDGRTMVDVYIDRKHGREPVAYLHPALEPILKETHGVIVYQEQVMQIAQVLSGYSLGGADLLRRAMGKKKTAEMAAQRARFVEGAQERGVRLELAENIFALMEKFAGYGFNKSHSAAYGLITLQTAWLKAHHPVEFMAALLTSEKDNTDKVVAYIAEARANKIAVLPPDANLSEREFGVADGKIRFGFGAIRGIGDGAIDAILEARASGPFGSMFDFCERVDLRRVSKKAVEALVCAGAFDFSGRHRRQLFDSVGVASVRAVNVQRDRAVGQVDLFGSTAAQPAPESSNVEPWSDREVLARERETIGFYVSGHPLDAYAKDIRRLARPISALGKIANNANVTVAGTVATVREFPTRTGKRMCRAVLEDLSGTIDIICFPGRTKHDGRASEPARGAGGYDVWQPMLAAGEPILVDGLLQRTVRDDGSSTIEIKVEAIRLLKAIREERLTRVEIRLTADQVTKLALASLVDVAQRRRGPTPLDVVVALPSGAEVLIADTKLAVQLSDELGDSIDRIFGAPVFDN